MALISSLPSEIEIIPLLPQHRQEVINLLMSSFFVEEPINAMLKFEIPQEPMAWIDHVVDESLRDQCSFVAVHKRSHYPSVVGVMLNGLSTRQQPEDTFPIASDKLKFIFALMGKVTSSHDLFDLYRTDRLLHCDIINIDEHERGQNLSTRLITASIARAVQLNIRGASVVCTNVISRRAFERQGFKVLNELRYSEYERLTDMGVNDRCTLLGKRLGVD